MLRLFLGCDWLTGARPFLQIIGSIKEFQAAMEDSKSEAGVFAALAPMAAKLDATFISITGHVEAAFGALTVGFGPAIQAGASFVDNISKGLMKVAQQISGFSQNLAEAFREGKIGELMNLTFAASVEFLTNMLISTLGSGEFWAGLFQGAAGAWYSLELRILEGFARIGQGLIASLDTAFQKFYEYLGTTKVGKYLGLSGYKAQTFSQNLDDEKKKGSAGMEGLQAMEGVAQSFARLGKMEVTDALRKAYANSGGAEQDKLKNFWAGIQARTPKQGDLDEKPKSGTKVVNNEKLDYKNQFTALEKMGFVGAGNPANDAARQTANNTQRTVELLNTAVTLLSTLGGQTNAI